MEQIESTLPPGAVAFLRELNALGVRYLCLGVMTYHLEGRPMSVIEVQFEDVSDRRIEQAAGAVGNQWCPSSSVGAYLDGPLGDCFSVHQDPVELDVFALEYEYMADEMLVGDVPVRMLSADRVRQRNSIIEALAARRVARDDLEVDLPSVTSSQGPIPTLVEDCARRAPVETTEGAAEEYVWVTIPKWETQGDADEYGLEPGMPGPGSEPPVRSARAQPPDYSDSLLLDVPLRFQRVVPSGAMTGGLEIDVEVLPDLTVVVSRRGERLVKGAYGGDRVRWYGESTSTMPLCARAMVGEDVRDMLELFHRELLDASRWTSDVRALELLASQAPDDEAATATVPVAEVRSAPSRGVTPWATLDRS